MDQAIHRPLRAARPTSACSFIPARSIIRARSTSTSDLGFTAYGRAVEIADDPRLDGRLPENSASWLPLI